MVQFENCFIEEEMNLFEIEDKLEESQEIKSAIEKINAAEIEAMQAIIKVKLAANGLDDLLNRFEEQMADVKLQSEKEKLRTSFRSFHHNISIVRIECI